MARAQQQLLDLVRDLLARTAAAGETRDAIAPDELATYCLHAIAAAASGPRPGDLPTDDALARLVTITVDGLRGPHRIAVTAAGPARSGASAGAARDGWPSQR